MSDAPITDAHQVRFTTLLAPEDAMWVPSSKAREIERKLSAAKADAESWREQAERFGQQLLDANEQRNGLLVDLHAAGEKIKRRDDWHAQHCIDIQNLTETIRYREESIKQLELRVSDLTEERDELKEEVKSLKETILDQEHHIMELERLRRYSPGPHMGQD